MLNREDVIGHRIRRLVADTTLSDDAINFADFICELDNGIAFRLPHDDESADWFDVAEVTPNHKPIALPKRQWWHYAGTKCVMVPSVSLHISGPVVL